MSYISAIRTGDDVLVWERNEAGEREVVTYPAPYYFYVDSNKGDYTSMFGDKLARYDFDTAREFQRGRQDCESSGMRMFESDIPPELRTLSAHYYGKAAPTLNIAFLDIEVDYIKEIGFSSVQNPYAPINSVALYLTHLNKYVILAVPPNLAPHKPNEDQWTDGPAPKSFIEDMRKIAAFPEDKELEVIFCKNEKDLLISLVYEIQDSDVLCGWNSDFFDVPYIGKRLQKIGRKFFNMLSFPEAAAPRFREVEGKYSTKQETLDLSGRISADYMILFKKYEMAERPSYKLASIADEILRDSATKEPSLPKLEYEGSLADLYRNNFAWFVRYNIRDTEVLQGFEERLGYVDLANQMMHMSTGVWKHVTGTLKLAELATINYCHHKLGGLIVNDVNVDTSGDTIQGAVVLLPQEGLHERIGSIDINSLYPSAIRAINISPETLLGQFVKNVEAAEHIEKDSMAMLEFEFDNSTHVPKKFRGQTMTMTATDWRAFLLDHSWAVSGYGTVFDQTKQGIIPKILDDWYAMRKEYQKLKAEVKAAGDAIKASYYDKLQYTYKIKLNSFYGALTNAYFRFYDLRMGESTTGTGRRILLHQCAQTCEVLDGKYAKVDRMELRKDPKTKEMKEHWGYSDKWSVVYGDTDSTYFTVPNGTEEEVIEMADGVGKIVNDSFPKFMSETFLCQPGFDNYIKCGREIVSDRGIFVDKKRYILHIIDNEGDKVDKMKVMGLDTKKTTLPAAVSKKLNSFVERYLKNEDWDEIAQDIVDYKDMLTNTTDVMSIGLPKGINKIEEYTHKLEIDKTARLPGHVAAGIFYNLCLEKFEDKASTPIMSGMKIKVFYLTQTYGRFKSIAIPVDIEELPPWFEEHFTISRKDHIQRLVDKPLGNIFKVTDKEVPTKQTIMNDTLMVF